MQEGQIELAQHRMLRLLPNGSTVFLRPLLDLVDSVTMRWFMEQHFNLSIMYQLKDISVHFHGSSPEQIDMFCMYLEYLKESGGKPYTIADGFELRFPRSGGLLTIHCETDATDRPIEQFFVESIKSPTPYIEKVQQRVHQETTFPAFTGLSKL